jgi:hypothetical protein
MIGSFMFVAASSLAYPFHLEWMEGQSIDIIQRVREGLPIYVKPSIDYVPFLYTPYYYYVAAFVSFFTGVDFLPGRLVSFAAALGTGAIIYKWLRREECAVPAAIAGAGAYYATYIISGRWLDVARVDSLFVCLSLLGLYVFYHFRGMANALLAAAILCAAYFTKQTAIVIFAPALAVMLLIDARHALLTAATLLSSIALFSLIGDWQSDGWFTFYVYQLAPMHWILKEHILHFWTRDMFPRLGIMLLLTVCTVAYFLYSERRKGLWYGALAAGFIACSYAGRLKWGGFINVLMPACCGLALLTGLSLGYLTRIKRYHCYLAIPLLVGAQLLWLAYNPMRYIPTQAAIDKGNRFLEEIGKVEGDVFMPEVQFVQTRVGKKSYSMNMAALDIIVAHMGKKDYIKQELLAEIRSAIASQRFGAVMPGGVIPLPDVKRYYQFYKRVPYPKEYIYLGSEFLKRDLMLPIAKEQIP